MEKDIESMREQANLFRKKIVECSWRIKAWELFLDWKGLVQDDSCIFAREQIVSFEMNRSYYRDWVVDLEKDINLLTDGKLEKVRSDYLD